MWEGDTGSVVGASPAVVSTVDTIMVDITGAPSPRYILDMPNDY